MNPNAAIIGAAAVLLGALLFFERQDSTGGKLLTKLPLSILFILAAVLQPHPHSAYYHRLLVGLILCFVGDGCLIFKGRGLFLTGLIAFLAGHGFYTAAFFTLSTVNVAFVFVLVFTAAVGWAIYLWLRPHLNGLKIPVTAYIVVISLMVCAAGGVFAGAAVSDAARWMVLGGAVFFYLSDLFVARNRFVRRGFENRLVGLPLYYSGQFLLAFSVGRV